MQSLPCLDKVIWFSRRALIDIPFAERYTELSHIIVQGPSFGKKGRLRAFIERHFRGSKPLQIFTKLRPIIVYTSKEPGCPRVELILKIIIILLIIFLGFIKSKPC